MSNNHKEISSEHKLRISVSATDRNETPEANQIFHPREIPLSQLEHTLKTKNYSAIYWRNSKRHSNNFARASFMIIDLDDGKTTLEQAVAKLQGLNLNHAIITSKRDGQPHDRFHILIPFTRTVVTLSEYKRIVFGFIDEHFPTADRGSADGARAFLGSPDHARFVIDFKRQNLDIDADANEETEPLTCDFAAIGESLRVYETWDDTLEVKRAMEKDVVKAIEQPSGTRINCPFHDDTAPSAFIGFSENSQNHYIHCSSCSKTYWHVNDGSVLERKLRRFWSHGESVYEAGFAGQEFSFQKIGKEKMFVKTGARAAEEQEREYSYLVREKHLHSLGIIEYNGDVHADAPMFEVWQGEGRTTVKIPAIREHTKDNVLVNAYLERTFGKYATFIKQWMAVYCYTNGKKLPTLILTGGRGTGKNTFAELVGYIFEPLSVTVSDLNGAFNPFAEKKLGILDESVRGGKLQYAELKKLSGSQWFEVNKKYSPQYKTRNNLNLIILSNELLPITVSASEQPSDPRNNQFFVYKMPVLQGSIDPDLPMKLRRCLGHYIRTELKSIFDGLPKTGYRYSIETPITEWEKQLFNFSKSEAEHLADGVIDAIKAESVDMQSEFYTHLLSNYLPQKLLTEKAGVKTHQLNQVLLILREKGVVFNGEAVRKHVAGKRLLSYELGIGFRGSQIGLADEESEANEYAENTL